MKEVGHIASGGLFKGEDTVIGVATIFGVIDGFFEGGADGAWGDLVGLTDAEIEHFAVRESGEGGGFGAFNLFELIDLVLEAEGGATDTLSEEGLEVHGGPLFFRLECEECGVVAGADESWGLMEIEEAAGTDRGTDEEVRGVFAEGGGGDTGFRDSDCLGHNFWEGGILAIFLWGWGWGWGW